MASERFLADGLTKPGGALEVGGYHRFGFLNNARPGLKVDLGIFLHGPTRYGELGINFLSGLFFRGHGPHAVRPVIVTQVPNRGLAAVQPCSCHYPFRKAEMAGRQASAENRLGNTESSESAKWNN